MNSKTTPTEGRKQQILELGAELLLVKGYCGFSYNDLSEKLGITKASIHHHFPSKEGLGIALCDHFEGQFTQFIGELQSAGSGPKQVLEALFQYSAQLADQGDRCCPGGVLQAEYESLPDELRARVDAMFQQHHSALTQLIEAGRAAGEFHFEGSASDQAWMVSSVMQGALLSSRVHGAEVFHAAVNQMLKSLIV